MGSIAAIFVYILTAVYAAVMLAAAGVIFAGFRKTDGGAHSKKKKSIAARILLWLTLGLFVCFILLVTGFYDNGLYTHWQN